MPSLLQKRVTQDLLDSCSRAWSTGSVREAGVKPCKTGAGYELSKLLEMVKGRGSWCAAVHGVTRSLDRTQRLNNSKAGVIHL